MDVSRQPSATRPAWRRALDRIRAARAVRRLWSANDPAPTLEDPVSQVVTSAQFLEEHYPRLVAELGEEPKLHRKQWEFVWILRVLEARGLLSPGRIGLGFGVGREPLVAAIAARGAHVLATDLPPNDEAVAGWRSSGEYGGSLEALNERGLCPPDAFSERVRFRFADMRRADEVEGSYDFVWSSCALEHLGSLGAGLDFVRSSLERVAPGGVAVHTTELNVSSTRETVESGPVVLYLREHLEALRDEVVARGFEMELRLHTGAGPLDLTVDRWPFDSEAHLKTLYGRFATTSVGLVMARPPVD